MRPAFEDGVPAGLVCSPRASIHGALDVAQTGERVLRQAFVAQYAVEALDAGVLNRLAGLTEVNDASNWVPQSRPW